MFFLFLGALSAANSITKAGADITKELSDAKEVKRAQARLNDRAARGVCPQDATEIEFRGYVRPSDAAKIDKILSRNPHSKEWEQHSKDLDFIERFLGKGKR